jgi:hypothetical protein
MPSPRHGGWKIHLQQYDAFANSLFGGRWLKQRSDWRSLQAAAAYLAEIKDPVLLSYLSKQEEPSVAAGYLSAVQNVVKMVMTEYARHYRL